jgi:malate dehydrogenase (oxaloacetate-decarboxylating)(NADP+)
MKDELKQAALDYHRLPQPGKLEIRPTKQLNDQRDLSLAYSPAAASQAIEADPLSALDYTCKGNLVGVITNGTAVLGLGAIGALASKPVMEGKAVLFKQFAGIDVFDIEINETDPQEFINTVARLEPTFGGINLEDIKAPECFIIEQELKQRMNIPVFHDDQHGTAVVVCAGMLNGLHLVGKQLDQVKLVTAGAGAAALACLDLLVELGLKKDNIIVTDNKGVVYEGRAEGMDVYKARYAVATDARVLSEALAEADIFLGLSTANVLKPEWLAAMAKQPLLFTLANPIPEIMPEVAREARPDAIIATGRSDYPNQVNNVLCFPFLFRGALDVGATEINSAMKMACVHAIAELARTEPAGGGQQAGGMAIQQFGPEYLIPTPFDPRLVEVVSMAVAQAAMDSGVALRPIQDIEAYRTRLQRIVQQGM